MRADGFIEQLFRRLDDTGAWLIVEAESEDDAQRRLDALPFPQAGLMTMTLSSCERL
jgi:hypothetical protein